MAYLLVAFRLGIIHIKLISMAGSKIGASLYPEDPNMAINLAHLYLFNNEYEKAKSIYQTNRKALLRPDYNGENLMRDDYHYLKQKNYDLTLMDRMFEELQVVKN